MAPIPFNKPFLTGDELDYIRDSVESGKISGNGKYTQICHSWLEEKFQFGKCLLTTSCTDALEMCAILAEIKPGDEVIMPSYTFVSTANAFVLRGAKIVFTDSRRDHPGVNEDKIEALITSKTRAIVVVHYAGVSCDMDKIMNLANLHNLIVIEDAAQAIDSYYSGQGGIQSLGSIGHMAAFSFHETKNIISGEGGMLVINDDQYAKRAEVIWEKGTNRSAFFRGEVDKYGWVDIGSSFLPSDITAAFLFAQLEHLDRIQNKRKALWNSYNESILPSQYFNKPNIPHFATNNAHMYYLVTKSGELRDSLISHLKENGIHSVFHYLSLHDSPLARRLDWKIDRLSETDRYSECLLRLPLFYELEIDQTKEIAQLINNFQR